MHTIFCFKSICLNIEFICPIPRQLSILESQLAYERERREVLEAELDQLRKQLQGTTDQLEHYQALAQKQVCATEICRTNLRILLH